MGPARTTQRLLLSPIDPSETEVLETLFAIQADPDTWTHLPSGIETDISQTRTLAEEHSASWRMFGLGWWAVSVREATGGLAAGQVIGLGGAGIRNPDIAAWNLGYRLTPAAWGHGFATELSVAAVRAAHAAQPDLPVTARALTQNSASWRVLEKVGLSLAWEGVVTSPVLTRGLTNRLYSDRTLPTGLFEELVALG